MNIKTIRKLVKEEIDKRQRIDELYAMGLASNKPSFHQEKKQAPGEQKKVYRSCKTLADIPKAYGTDERNVVCLMDEEIDLRNSVQIQKDRTKGAVSEFQRHYRSLDDATRFQFRKWLNNALIKQLSFEEVNALVAKANASAKGLIEPQNKNEKPD